MLWRNLFMRTALPFSSWVPPPVWVEDVRRAFAALGWTVSIGRMPNTDYDYIELVSDGRELEPATLGNLLTELGVTSGEYSFDLSNRNFKHDALTFVDADWWERCPDPRGLLSVAYDVAHERQLRKLPDPIDERKGWLTVLALRPFCRRSWWGDPELALKRNEDLIAYLDATDHGAVPAEARFDWMRKEIAPIQLALDVAQLALEDLRESRGTGDTPPAQGEPGPERAAEIANATVAAVVRDIFGNPFRPSGFSPSWRTDTVVTLARGICQSHDFGAIPILADALQDAGCSNEDILDHCRGPGPHVRGCWVVGLVLGKE